MKKIYIIWILLLLMSCNTQESSVGLTSETQIPQDTVISETEEDIIETIKTETMKNENKEETIQECLVFDDFTNTDKNNWIIVNDGVMWWKSIWNYDIQENIFNLSGTINTNGGGFSSVRAWLAAWILSEYNSIKLTVKPDGRNYQITFRDNNRRWISHRAILPFSRTWDFEEIDIQINDLEPVFFGRRVDAAAFKKENAREIWFIISDGIDWGFSLKVDSISFCK